VQVLGLCNRDGWRKRLGQDSKPGSVSANSPRIPSEYETTPYGIP